jgi:hypothetical protein
LSIDSTKKASLKVINLLFLLALYIHVLGCFHYYVVSSRKVWIPPLDFIYLKSDIYNDHEGFDLWKTYWNSIYTSVMIFGLNEVAPRTSFELGFVSSVMLISAMVNANIFGTMTVLV